jgi:hypothetical protein
MMETAQIELIPASINVSHFPETGCRLFSRTETGEPITQGEKHESSRMGAGVGVTGRLRGTLNE